MSNKRPKAEPHKGKTDAEKFAKLAALLRQYPASYCVRGKLPSTSQRDLFQE